MTNYLTTCQLNINSLNETLLVSVDYGDGDISTFNMSNLIQSKIYLNKIYTTPGVYSATAMIQSSGNLIVSQIKGFILKKCNIYFDEFKKFKYC